MLHTASHFSLYGRLAYNFSVDLSCHNKRSSSDVFGSLGCYTIMKKGFIILLIPLFVFSTMGVSITSLYCQGKLYEVGLTVHPCCNDVNQGGCCATESVFLKITDSFIKDGHGILAKVFDFEKPVNHNLRQSERLPGLSLDKVSKMNHWRKACLSPRYMRILFCSFLI